MRLLAVAPNPSIDRFFGLEQLRVGDVNRPTVEVRVAGGKALNVARAAAALGADVTVVGILGGHAGRWIAEELDVAGIRGFWEWVEGETRSCVAIHDQASGALTELNEAGPTVDADAWERVLAAVESELAGGEIGLVAISGSMPPGAPLDGVARAVGLANARGAARSWMSAGSRSCSRSRPGRGWSR